ncbi:LLM class flavin-dependent oxidoreductase [Arsenicitalea aurantiaca]|uniref:LLM class flavin-dependent oxidoreductase n=1 Tax=Arsenicitalea aurantiaca TaxID=1783274 RepID=A0A433XLR7_9HYPH|nr:LLM class flavin-dependent oxidoreductase [Arsenicitalea aurantiaca]RUT35025.1 LLM class flavin-dependent oxidoreductase [Arsenicitalea aurantiaca]
MELGLYSFAENTPDPATGVFQSPQQRLADLLEEIQLADELGLDFYGLGEHHRPDFVASAPVTILAAAAARTKRIRLSTAVTVLSSEDPIRVYQQFATLDLISGGRAEIMAGRGSFIESFPLFGYDLEDYDALFDEKLELLLKLREPGAATWPGGKFTRPIPGIAVYPEPVQRPIPLWVAVGGTPNSVARAAYHGLPLMLAIIGGMPRQFAPLIQFYRDSLAQLGKPGLPVGVASHGFIAENSQDALDIAFPAHHAAMSRIGRERGWPPTTRAQFEAGATPEGAYFMGSPQQVIDKILAQHEWFGHQRFGLQLSVGTLPHAKVMKAIELYGTVVKPAVDKAIGGSAQG